MNASHYPWNIQVDLGGTTFTGPGMESRQEAEAVRDIVERTGGVDGVQVIEQ